MSHRRGQRKLPFLFALLLTFALIAAACGGNDDDGNEEGGGGSSTTQADGGNEGDEGAGAGFNQPEQEGEPQVGGSIVFGVESTIASLDPAGSLAQPSDVLTALAIYDHLIDYAPDGKLIPSLATEWESSEDLQTWTIKVRTDVEFSDGTPFNAQAVKAQFDRFLDPATNCTCADTVKQITSVEAPDDETVIFELNAPNAFWANTLAGTLGFIASPTATEEFGADYARNPVGTGPFVLEDYDSLVLKKNPNYWKKDEEGRQLPYLDEIKIEPIPDSKVRLQSLRSGDIDIFQTADTDNIVDVLESGDQYKVQRITGSSSTIVLFNLERPPFDDVRMRQAFAYALDRDEINNVQYRGSRVPAYAPFEPGSQFLAEGVGAPEFDLEKAKELVQELKDEGKPVEYTAICIPTDESRRVLGIVEQQMEKAGMQVTNEFKDQGSYVNQIFAKTGDYQAGCFRSPQIIQADQLYGSLHTDQPGNVMFYSNPTVDEALENIRATTDADEHITNLKTVQEEIAKDIPTLSLLYDLFGNIHNDKVSGLPAPEPWSLGAIKVAGLYLEK